MIEPGEVDIDFFIRLIKHVREAGGYVFPAEFDGQIAFAFPRSINWETLEQREFSPIAEAVYGIIEEVLQVNIKELMDAPGEKIRRG
jgi:hypothetical protein